MSKNSESTAARIRSRVAAVDPRSFLYARDFEGSRPAVETELSRMVSRGELVRVRKGLYWKPPTRGRRRPPSLDVGLEIGGPGSGPAGVSAARVFGLTTQVPAVESVAVPGRAPQPLDDVQFSSRPYERREMELNPYEVALIEVLRDFDRVSERSLEQLADVVSAAVDDGRIRPRRIAEAVDQEWDLSARDRWRQLERELDLLVPT